MQEEEKMEEIKEIKKMSTAPKHNRYMSNKKQCCGLRCTSLHWLYFQVLQPIPASGRCQCNDRMKSVFDLPVSAACRHRGVLC